MVKLHFKKEGDTKTISNISMPDSEEVTLTKPQAEKAFDGTHDFDVKNNKIVLTKIEKVISPEQQTRIDLKVKLKNGTLTNEEVQAALKLLL